MPEEYIWPMKRKRLEDYYEMVLRCGKCAYCRHVWPSNTQDEKFAYQCPSGERYKFDSYYATGIMEIVRGFLEGELGWSDRLIHILYSCTECGACEEWDKVTKRLYPLKVIQAMKVKAVEDGYGPPPPLREMAKKIKDTYNPFGEPHAKRVDWLPKDFKNPSKTDLVYFSGCTTSYLEKGIARAHVETLKVLGVNFGVLGSEEWCCGHPLFTSGYEKEGVELMKHNLDVIKKMGAKKVLFSCPSCYRTFNEILKYGIELDFDIAHTSEFIFPLLKKYKKTHELKKIEKKITYHDSCSLGRHMGVYEPPRDILTSIPGVELIEMPRNRRNSWCCGGVISSIQYPDYAAWVSEKRLEEVGFIGAQTLATTCPWCKRMLKLFKSRSPSTKGVEVKDVVEVLHQALGGR